MSVFFCIICLVCNYPKQVREAREFSLKDGSDWDANQMMRDCCTRTEVRIVILICANEGILCTTLPLCLPRDKYCYFSILIVFHFDDR